MQTEGISDYLRQLVLQYQERLMGALWSWRLVGIILIFLLTHVREKPHTMKQDLVPFCIKLLYKYIHLALVSLLRLTLLRGFSQICAICSTNEHH